MQKRTHAFWTNNEAKISTGSVPWGYAKTQECLLLCRWSSTRGRRLAPPATAAVLRVNQQDLMLLFSLLDFFFSKPKHYKSLLDFCRNRPQSAPSGRRQMSRTPAAVSSGLHRVTGHAFLRPWRLFGFRIAILEMASRLANVVAAPVQYRAQQQQSAAL